GGIAKEPLLVFRIDPGTSNYLGAIPGSDLMFIRVHQGIECSRIDQSLLHQQRFQRLGSQRRVGGNFLVNVIRLLRLNRSRSSCRYSSRSSPLQKPSPVNCRMFIRHSTLLFRIQYTTNYLAPVTLVAADGIAFTNQVDGLSPYGANL